MFDNLSEKFANAFKRISGNHKITEDNIEDILKDVRTALLEADVNFVVVKEFIAKVKEKALGQKVISGVNPQEQFVKIVHDELCAVMGQAHEEINLKNGLNVILVVGLNGQGKTTFSGKIAHYIDNKLKRKVLLIPADNFRPAAKKQLETLGKQISVSVFDSDLTKNPTQIVEAGLRFASENKFEVVVIDTAGRLHIDENLMKELSSLKKSLESYKPEVLLCSDAMTGQMAVDVALTFQKEVGITGLILSKMDSDAKGGAALSIRHVTGVPIKFISMGEKMKDLELFHPDRLAKRILDMGDVLTLVEKAQDVYEANKDASDSMMENFKKGKFTVNDFLKQMEMMKSLGSMTSILKMIPGMGGMLRELGDLSPAEAELKSMKIIISSMTQKERDDYKLLMKEKTRIARIARGAGVEVGAVEKFLQKFKDMEQMMKGLSGMMGGGAGGMGMGMPSMPTPKGFRPQKGGIPSLEMPKSGEAKKKTKGPWGKSFF